MSEVLIDFVGDAVRKLFPRPRGEFFLTGFAPAHVEAYRDFCSASGREFRQKNKLRFPVKFVDREWWHLNPLVVAR